MNKSQLLQEFTLLIENTLTLAIESQKNTVDYVTHEDNKPENQYDTRGLEASYLARGQAERVADLRECLAFFKTATLKNYNENTPIGNTSLIQILDVENEQENKYLFMMPKGGGLALDFEKHHIQVVTASSPLGGSLVGKKVGEVIHFTSGNKKREYEIMSVL